MKTRLLLLAVILVAFTTIGSILLHGNNIAVLNPQGIIAEQQRNLIVFTFLLSMVVILPVFVLLFFISWKYRATNPKKPKYTPDWAGNTWLEAVWWGIPCMIIVILSVVTWQTSHSLDPYKPLDSVVKPVNVQVVALQWKWLFIYPDQGVASVNLLEIPVDTPINFTITADSPMNSFWIPSLGGQVYAMSGMSTKLHLMADNTGDYRGSSANISGKDFAKMNFTTRAVTAKEFDSWTKKYKQSTDRTLTMDSYNDLAQPGVIETPTQFKLNEPNLYDKILMKYMAPMEHEAMEMDHASMESMPGMGSE